MGCKINCLEGFKPTGKLCPGGGACCGARWTKSCGEGCVKAKCDAFKGEWIPLDYKTNPYTCETNGASTSIMVEPADPCKKYQDEKKADKAVAAALKSEIRFGGGSTVIQSSGFATLDKVAKILKQYPWMKIEVEAHSDAGAGSICSNLTKGRAASTEKYLRSKGVKNLMGKPVGKCGVKRAIMIASSGGRSSAPAGCSTSIMVEPADPCKKYQDEKKA